MTFIVGTGRSPVSGYGALPVAFMENEGKRAEAVAFKIGSGKRPDTDALKLVVKFTVGNGGRPDLSEVVFAVELAVGRGKRPELGAVGYMVKFNIGEGWPETEPIVYAEALALGKMPAETAGTVLMFNVGKGRVAADAERIGNALTFDVVEGLVEVDKLAKFVRIWLADGDNPKLVVETVEFDALWLATVKGSWETVVASVVVPRAIVVVPRFS